MEKKNAILYYFIGLAGGRLRDWLEGVGRLFGLWEDIGGSRGEEDRADF